MTSLLKVRSLRSICTRSFFRVSFALLLLVSVRNASADFETWNGSVSSDWDYTTTSPTSPNNIYQYYPTYAPNWTGYYSAYQAGMVPGSGDIAFFSKQTPNMAVTFSLASNNPGQVYFQNAGYDYTIGSLSSTNGLTFNDYSGIYVQANLQGHGGYEDIEAPLTGNGLLFLANYSPADPEADAVGYNNTLQVDGSITMNTNQALLVYGSGNVDFTGTISGGNNGYGVQTEMMGAATATFSGTSSDTGVASSTWSMAASW
jgi:hypothetical protein